MFPVFMGNLWLVENIVCWTLKTSTVVAHLSGRALKWLFRSISNMGLVHLKVRSAKIDGKSLVFVQQRYIFSSGPEKVSNPKISKLFLCSHKTKISRSLQKTYLEHRPRPPNVLSQVIWFITRVNFRHFGPSQGLLLADFPQSQKQTVSGTAAVWRVQTVSAWACDKTF